MVKKEIPIMQTVRMCDFCEETYPIKTCSFCGKDVCMNHWTEVELTWRYTLTLCPNCKNVNLSEIKKVSNKIQIASRKVSEYEKELAKLIAETEAEVKAGLKG